MGEEIELTQEEKEKSMRDIEEFTKKMYARPATPQAPQKLTMQINEAVYRELYEKVLLEVQKHLNQIEMTQNSLLAIYANKVEPKRFPLSAPEQQEALEILKIGFEAFLEGLKEDRDKAANAFKKEEVEKHE